MRAHRLFWTAGILWGLLGAGFTLADETSPAPEEETAEGLYKEAVTVSTEDQVLKEQLLKVASILQETHQKMTQRRRELQQTTDQTRKTALYTELDGLRKERDMLERLLHDLVEEATATEWTAIDEALRRAKSFERHQEKAYQKEENLRERKQ